MKKQLLTIIVTTAAMLASLNAQEGAMPPPPKDGITPHPPKHVWGERKPEDFRFGKHKPGELPHISPRGNEMLVIMTKLKKENPEEYARLEELRKTDIRAFITEIKKYIPTPSGTMKKVGQLGHECNELAGKYAQAQNDEEKKAIETELRAKIKEGFDYMLQDYTERLQRMTKHLEALKENEDAILEERFKMYTNPPQRPKE